MVEIVMRVTVRDLADRDLPSCAWAGTALHLRQVAQELERARRDEVDYLAVCPPSNIPVAIGGVDYQVRAGTGTIWQLAVHPALQSCGLGTVLIRAAEGRILARGLDHAALSVEETNPRALALYERLGFVSRGRKLEAWDSEGPDGEVSRYESMCVVMSKPLRPGGPNSW